METSVRKTSPHSMRLTRDWETPMARATSCCDMPQEAFFEGHALAFAHFGGVPTGLIRYDNLKAAVTRILLGRDRVENERFVALRSHYLLTEQRGAFPQVSVGVSPNAF